MNEWRQARQCTAGIQTSLQGKPYRRWSKRFILSLEIESLPLDSYMAISFLRCPNIIDSASLTLSPLKPGSWAWPHLTTTCVHTAYCCTSAALRYRLRWWKTLTRWVTQMNTLCCSTHHFLSMTLQYTKMPHYKLYRQIRPRDHGIYPSGSLPARARAVSSHI